MILTNKIGVVNKMPWEEYEHDNGYQCRRVRRFVDRKGVIRYDAREADDWDRNDGRAARREKRIVGSRGEVLE